MTGVFVGPVSATLSDNVCVVTVDCVVADVVVTVVAVVVVSDVTVVFVVDDMVVVVVVDVVVVVVVLEVEVVDSRVRLRIVVVGFAVVSASVVVVHFLQRLQVRPQYLRVLLLLHCCGGMPLFCAGQFLWSAPRQHFSSTVDVVVGSFVVVVTVAVVVVFAFVLSGFFGGGPIAPPPQPQHAIVASTSDTA